MGKNMAKEPCIISGTTNYVHYSKGLIRNVDSGLIVAEYIPSEKELRKLYSKDYFFGQEYSDYLADRPALETNFRKRIKALRELGALGDDKSLVEVGCAYGYFLNLVKKEVGSVKGFDVSNESIKYARDNFKVDASIANFLDQSFNKQVDIVCMWDVIEHVSNPAAFIKKTNSILKKGGMLALTTGDIGTFVPRIRKGKWRMIHPPTHIYYFDRKTMTELLDKYGFDIVDYRYDAIYRNVGSVINQLIINRKASGKNPYILRAFLWFAKKTKLARLNIPINLRDIMNVTAVKR